MLVSHSELVRTMQEGIRMLGFSYSQADDSAESVIWTECVFGQGYELLRDAGQDTMKPVGPVACQRDDKFTTVTLGSRPAFAFAARIADLAIAGAATDGSVVVKVSGGRGQPALPYIAARIARAGYHAVAVWHSGSDDDAPSPVVAVAPANAKVLGLSSDKAALAGLTSRELSLGTDPTVSSNWQQALQELTPDISEVVVLAVKADAKSVKVKLDEAAPGFITKVVEPDALIDKAIRDGLEVDVTRHRILTGLTGKIRLPSSERSRAQAG